MEAPQYGSCAGAIKIFSNAAWAEVSPLQAALLDFLFSARLPAAMNMILPSAVLAQRLCVREIHRRASGTYLVPQKEVERRGHRLLVRPGHKAERQTIEDAFASLRVLKRDNLGFPDWEKK